MHATFHQPESDSQNLKEIIKNAARKEGRSLNSEVIKRIERSLKEDGFIKA